MDAIADAGIRPEPGHILKIESATPRFEIGYHTALTMLQQPSRPTAIFALTDETAIGALHATAELGIRVPLR
jgi:LacI family transcriptional regulator